MLKIKLARFGKKKQPMYRLIVNEAKSKRDGAYVASIGTYFPTQNPKVLEVDLKEYALWLKKGAQPTETVAALVKRLESGNPFPPKKVQPNRKAKARAAAEAEAKASAAPVVEEKPETPVVEAAPAEEVKDQPAA
jgi:small subunit ribosomal protein S16